MRDFPSCFGENGVQIADASSPFTATTPKISQNLVTCVYQCRLRNFSSFTIAITWTKTLMGQALSVEIHDSTTQSLCKLEIKPWIFSKRRGSRNLEMGSKFIDFHWDLSAAKFSTSSPEPTEDFYFAISTNQELILMLGDMEKEVQKNLDLTSFAPKAIFTSKKEHVFGKKVYSTTAQFCGKGQMHEISIECDNLGTNSKDPWLLIRVDGKAVMQVRHLRWKFRGNYTILVDGLPVEVYWDVYGWMFGKLTGKGVFLFQTCLSAEKLWANRCVSDMGLSQGLGFSLVLCAWKNE